MANRASPYSTGRPFSTSFFAMVPPTSASISFINFMDSNDAEYLAGLNPVSNLNKGGRLRRGGLVKCANNGRPDVEERVIFRRGRSIAEFLPPACGAKPPRAA